MLNFDDDCIEGGSKVQPCDAVSHVLAAHKSASFEKNFRIGLLHYYMVAVVIFFFAVRVGDTSLFLVIKYTRLKPK